MLKKIYKIDLRLVMFLIFIIFPLGNSHAKSLNLSLNEYLCQVRHNNLGVEGSFLIASGARQRVGEGRLIMKPSLFAEGQYLKDSYDPNWSPILGSKSRMETYKVGVSQTTPYGVQGKIYYNYQHQVLNSVAPIINQSQTTTASSPIVEVDVPLSRNFAGRETRANAQLIDSRAQLTHVSERYKNKMLMATAESTYWRLAILRLIVTKQRESLGRSIRIQEWTLKRSQNKLAEDADLLQSLASVDSKKLDIQSALNDVKIAELNFNTLRGCHEAYVPEQLTSVRTAVNHICLPQRPLVRDDVRIAEQQQKIEIANAKIGIEKNKPDLDLYASYALNGNNPSSNQAISESFSADYPSTAVGLRLTMPLDVGRLRRDRLAYKKEIRGAQYQFKQKVFENQQLWEELTLKIENAMKRFDIATQLETLQLKKLEAQRQQLTFGRTTTYQVLLFEQDYANAQIASLIIQDEILALQAQLKTFGV